MHRPLRTRYFNIRVNDNREEVRETVEFEPGQKAVCRTSLEVLEDHGGKEVGMIAKYRHCRHKLLPVFEERIAAGAFVSDEKGRPSILLRPIDIDG